jgi:hypothetical protein
VPDLNFNAPEHASTLADFAEFLAQRRERIIAQWLERVRADERIQPAGRLSGPALIDHMPVLLDHLCTLLRSRGDFPRRDSAPEKDAQDHGLERLEQGYRVDELLWEITQFRVTLIQLMADFGSQRPTFTDAERVATQSKVHLFLDDLAARSAGRFVDAQKAELQRMCDSRLYLMRTVSHELRNVLNGLGLAAHSLEDEETTDLPLIRDMVGRNVHHMRELLDDLLQLSAIDSGQSVVRVSEFTPAALLHDLTVTYEPMAEARGLSLQSQTDAGVGAIANDYLKCKQIAANLISNAIKYTTRGQVSVAITDSGPDLWSIVISDTGVGIPYEEQSHVFEELYRVEKTAHIQGVGLGLSIVSRLVQLLHGTIRMESRPGEGSRFEVTLPRVYVSSAA